VSKFVFGIVSIEAWAFVVMLCIAFIDNIPIGMIQDITNQEVGVSFSPAAIVVMFSRAGLHHLSPGIEIHKRFKLGH
jgi:hypothetical protein